MSKYPSCREYLDFYLDQKTYDETVSVYEGRAASALFNFNSSKPSINFEDIFAIVDGILAKVRTEGNNMTMRSKMGKILLLKRYADRIHMKNGKEVGRSGRGFGYTVDDVDQMDDKTIDVNLEKVKEEFKKIVESAEKNSENNLDAKKRIITFKQKYNNLINGTNDKTSDNSRDTVIANRAEKRGISKEEAAEAMMREKEIKKEKDDLNNKLAGNDSKDPIPTEFFLNSRPQNFKYPGNNAKAFENIIMELLTIFINGVSDTGKKRPQDMIKMEKLNNQLVQYARQDIVLDYFQNNTQIKSNPENSTLVTYTNALKDTDLIKFISLADNKITNSPLGAKTLFEEAIVRYAYNLYFAVMERLKNKRLLRVRLIPETGVEIGKYWSKLYDEYINGYFGDMNSANNKKFYADFETFKQVANAGNDVAYINNEKEYKELADKVFLKFKYNDSTAEAQRENPNTDIIFDVTGGGELKVFVNSNNTRIFNSSNREMFAIIRSAFDAMLSQKERSTEGVRYTSNEFDAVKEMLRKKLYTVTSSFQTAFNADKKYTIMSQTIYEGIRSEINMMNKKISETGKKIELDTNGLCHYVNVANQDYNNYNVVYIDKQNIYMPNEDLRKGFKLRLNGSGIEMYRRYIQFDCGNGKTMQQKRSEVYQEIKSFGSEYVLRNMFTIDNKNIFNSMTKELETMIFDVDNKDSIVSKFPEIKRYILHETMTGKRKFTYDGGSIFRPKTIGNANWLFVWSPVITDIKPVKLLNMTTMKTPDFEKIYEGFSKPGVKFRFTVTPKPSFRAASNDKPAGFAISASYELVVTDILKGMAKEVADMTTENVHFDSVDYLTESVYKNSNSLQEIEYNMNSCISEILDKALEETMAESINEGLFDNIKANITNLTNKFNEKFNLILEKVRKIYDKMKTYITEKLIDKAMELLTISIDAFLEFFGIQNEYTIDSDATYGDLVKF